jgi:hypothetical protein
MDHFLPCPCGAGVRVSEAAAGTTAHCVCGRPVQVPSFRELRQLSGQPAPAPPPERVVEAMLLAGQLPQEYVCVLCGTWTDHTVSYRTTCERAVVIAGTRTWWEIIPAVAAFGWIGAMLLKADRRPDREVGSDKIYTLPLRVCPDCAAQLTTENAVRNALARVPVYRRLLQKYPDADIELPVAS